MTHPDVAPETALTELLAVEVDERVYRVGNDVEIDVTLTVDELLARVLDQEKRLPSSHDDTSESFHGDPHGSSAVRGALRQARRGPRNTRIDRYRRYLEQLPPKGPELDRGIFIDPPNSPIQHGLDRLLYVLREIHELTWIGEGLSLDAPCWCPTVCD